MDTRLEADLTELRRQHLSLMAIDLATKMREALIQKSREQGIVPTQAVTRMCGDLANVCADVVMREAAVIQSTLKLRPEDVPPTLRNGTTQEIIDSVASPLMAADIAGTMMKAGLVRPTLSIPSRGGVSATFAAWGVMMRQGGPAGMPNAPRLDYGKGTTVFPRGEGFSAEGHSEPVPPGLYLGLGRQP